MEIDEHVGCAMSGLIADARTLVEHARVETQVLFCSCIPHSLFITYLFISLYVHTQNHRFSYGEPMTVESTTQAICDLALRFGEGEEESMVSIFCYYYQNTTLPLEFLIYLFAPTVTTFWSFSPYCWS